MILAARARLSLSHTERRQPRPVLNLPIRDCRSRLYGLSYLRINSATANSSGAALRWISLQPVDGDASMEPDRAQNPKRQ